MDITDGFAESLMRTVMKHTRILMKEPNNYESRAEVMWAGSLSHNDITGSRSSSAFFARNVTVSNPAIVSALHPAKAA